MEVGRPLSTRSEKRWSKAPVRVNVVSTWAPSSPILISEISASARACEANKKKHRSASFALIGNRSLALRGPPPRTLTPAPLPSPPTLPHRERGKDKNRPLLCFLPLLPLRVAPPWDRRRPRRPQPPTLDFQHRTPQPHPPHTQAH